MYDTKRAHFIGKQSRLYLTWSIAGGFLVAKLLLAKPEAARILWNEEDTEVIHAFINYHVWFQPKEEKRSETQKTHVWYDEMALIS